MSSPLSTHIPGFSGAIETVPAATGTLIVNTGLRDIQSFSASLAQDSVANAASVSWEFETAVPGSPRKVELKVWKADGATAASVAAKVSWMALGK